MCPVLRVQKVGISALKGLLSDRMDTDLRSVWEKDESRLVICFMQTGRKCK